MQETQSAEKLPRSTFLALKFVCKERLSGKQTDFHADS
jgi:hypothetical protein